MDVFNYIDKYGDRSFSDFEFNDVDAGIFSFLSYVDFNGIVSNDKISLYDAAVKHKNTIDINKKDAIAVKDATKLLYYLMNKKRYSNCFLYNYVYVGDCKVQFSAICINYYKSEVFISYEGTDLMVSGWHENLILCYEYPTLSHKMAIDYLNRNGRLLGDLVIGGHSKGGNLALVAAMNCNFFVKRKIKKIYSMDGPGLLPNVLKSLRYKSIKNKYLHIIPHNSYVGILLESENDYIIKANIDGLLAHDFLYWDISDSTFNSEKISKISLKLKNNINNYLFSLGSKQLRDVIYNFDYIFGKLDITSFSNFTKDKRRLFNLFKEVKRLDSESKKILIGLLNVIFNSIGGAAKEDFKEITNRFKDHFVG